MQMYCTNCLHFSSGFQNLCQVNHFWVTNTLEKLDKKKHLLGNKAIRTGLKFNYPVTLTLEDKKNWAVYLDS